MKKVLVIGENGQVGRELTLSAPKNIELYTSSREEKSDQLKHVNLDLCDSRRIKSIITELRPDFVINAAAYTAVDRAETEKDLAMKINCDAPKAMAEAVKEIGSWLIHYSTDYVYDGTGEHARTEDEPTNPINFYGHSKLEGENAIRASGAFHVIFRTSWVFAAHGHNFVKTMLRLGAEREELSVVDDQIGSPTSARLIADVTWKMVEKIIDSKISTKANLFHLCGKGYTSWHGFAEEIFKQANELGIPLKANRINAVNSAAFETSAKRPNNSRLNCERLEQHLGLSLSDWQKDLLTIIQLQALEER